MQMTGMRQSSLFGTGALTDDDVTAALRVHNTTHLPNFKRKRCFLNLCQCMEPSRQCKITARFNMIQTYITIPNEMTEPAQVESKVTTGLRSPRTLFAFRLVQKIPNRHPAAMSQKTSASTEVSYTTRSLTACLHVHHVSSCATHAFQLASVWLSAAFLVRMHVSIRVPT